MMYIKQVKSYDSFSGEADIIVSDGVYELLCYYHPAENIDLGAEVKEISSLFAKDVTRAECKEYLIQKEEGYYSYHLQGKVIDTEIPMICIGNINIELDYPIAKDIKIGDYVELKVHRLNCII